MMRWHTNNLLFSKYKYKLINCRSGRKGVHSVKDSDRKIRDGRNTRSGYLNIQNNNEWTWKVSGNLTQPTRFLTFICESDSTTQAARFVYLQSLHFPGCSAYLFPWKHNNKRICFSWPAATSDATKLTGKTNNVRKFCHRKIFVKVMDIIRVYAPFWP